MTHDTTRFRNSVPAHAAFKFIRSFLFAILGFGSSLQTFGLSVHLTGPASVQSGAQYTVSAYADYSPNTVDVFLFKDTVLVANASHQTSTSQTDQGPRTVTYSAEAHEWATGGYANATLTVQIEGGANEPPIAGVVVGDFNSGDVVVRPNGGSLQIAAKFLAVDRDGNLTGIRPNIWHPDSGYYWNNNGAMLNAYDGYGSEIDRSVALDKDGDWYFWTDSVDGGGVENSTPAWTSGFKITVSEASPTAPVATVDVLGLKNGATITKQKGLPLTITVHYDASDADSNLTDIRPQIWHPDSGYYWNNGGNWITQTTGDSGEVVETYTINHTGDWYFWTDAQDANGQFVNSGAWTSAFKLHVVENAVDNGQSEWMDVNGDGILDEVIRPNTARFNYTIDNWYTDCTSYWYYPVNDVFDYWDIWWPWGDFGDNFEWIWYPDTFWIEYECDTYVTPLMQFDTESGYEYHLFADYSGESSVNMNNWVDIASGVFGSGTQNLLLDDELADDFYMDQYFLVRYGRPITGLALSDAAGNLIATVPFGQAPLVEIPTDKTIFVAGIDDLGKMVQVVAGSWTVMINGQVVSINGQPAINLSLNRPFGIFGLGGDQFQIQLTLPGMAMQTSSWTGANPKLEFVKYTDSYGTFISKRNANQLTLSQLNPVSELNVARWIDGFAKSTDVQPINGFIEMDPDQYFIKLTDSQCAGNGTAPVTIETKTLQGTLDSPHTLTLTESPTNSGVFYSKPLMLMSDQFDDNYPRRGWFKKKDNYAEDPTSQALLETTVAATYAPLSGTKWTAIATVPIRKKVNVEIIVFNKISGALPVRSLSKVENDWMLVEQRYAQVGVKINWHIRGNAYTDPDAVVQQLFNKIHLACLNNKSISTTAGQMDIASDLTMIIDRFGSPTNNTDVQVFYVPGLKALSSPTNSTLAWGFSIPLRGPIATQVGYANTSFIAGNFPSSLLFTPAHELGHLLTNGVAEGIDSHHSSYTNLLYKMDIVAYGVFAKRLDETERQNIYNNSTIVHNP